MNAANDNTAVHTRRTEGVLVIEIHNPPVNATSAAVRQGLIAALQVLEADPDIEAAVLIGAGSTFVAGSDLREFGQPLQAPQLPAVITAIEQCSKPVVAALRERTGREVAVFDSPDPVARQTLRTDPEAAELGKEQA